MNLKITGLNFDVTEAIKNYVSEKLERINRHAANAISVTITLSVEKLNASGQSGCPLVNHAPQNPLREIAKRISPSGVSTVA